jgi:hypothetical protein
MREYRKEWNRKKSLETAPFREAVRLEKRESALKAKLEIRRVKREAYWLKIEEGRERSKENKRRHKCRQRKRKYWSDPSYRMRQCLRSRMCEVLKGLRKSETTDVLLGCTRQELLSHLTAKFKEGMSLENYGPNGWHIDHIVPCASFDLSDPIPQRMCFSYTNLQPLWAMENVEKGARI